MKAFEMARPSSPEQAVTQLSEPTGKTLALAGGQDVLSLMKDYVLQPDRVVNLKSLPGLRQIAVSNRGDLSLGALVTLSQLAEDEAVRRGWPALAQAAGEAATPQIRNQATIGGNLCQRPRCWYYRAEHLDCLRKTGDVCLSVAGDNRYHSIFGDGPCYAPQMSALAGPFLVYAATVTVHGPVGERSVSVPELYTALPGQMTGQIGLEGNEIVVGVRVPAAAGLRVYHEEVRFKQAFDWPLAAATVGLVLDGARVKEARIVLGSVAPIPWVSQPAQAALTGQEVTEATAAAAAEAALAQADPMTHNAYKVPLTRNLLRRAILAAAGKGEGR